MTTTKNKKSALQLTLSSRLEKVGMACYPSEVRLRSMLVYVIKFDDAEHPLEVVLPSDEVAFQIGRSGSIINEETLRNYDVPIIDAVAYALAFYWSMPSSVKTLINTFGELGTLRVQAVEHMKRFYGLD